MYLLIMLFAVASYFLGAKAICQNKYYPSIYSRIIWLLTSINATASVILLKNNFYVIAFAIIGLLGSIVILLLSLKKSKRIFGMTEVISTALLIVSLAVWLFMDIPLLNLSIGLIVVLIGGIPTLKKVINDPKDENLLLWLLFTIASVITVIGADKSHLSGFLYPTAIAAFDGTMTLLCFRRYSYLWKYLKISIPAYPELNE